MRVADIRRVDFGFFVRPGAETGNGIARAEPCLGYLVDHAGGLVLVDTGMGSHPDVDAHYRPTRRPLETALAGAGGRADQIVVVVNCHLHFDHCGANPRLPGRPIVVQRVELDAAHGVDYTLPELVDAPGLSYEVLEGEAEVLPGVHVVPTPGHTAGHQSLVVRCDDGTVVVAGQCHTTAAAFGSDVLAERSPQGLVPPPPWVERLLALDPRRVVFAHDRGVWEP